VNRHVHKLIWDDRHLIILWHFCTKSHLVCSGNIGLTTITWGNHATISLILVLSLLQPECYWCTMPGHNLSRFKYQWVNTRAVTLYIPASSHDRIERRCSYLADILMGFYRQLCLVSGSWRYQSAGPVRPSVCLSATIDCSLAFCSNDWPFISATLRELTVLMSAIWRRCDGKFKLIA